MLRYSAIMECDVVNAIGVSNSLFFQGCSHHCKNCFNPETWAFDGGKEFSEEIRENFIHSCQKPYITSVAILGGDPMEQPLEELKSFLSDLRALEKPIILWTGYRFYDIIESEDLKSVLPLIDYLIDGEYQERLRDTTLKLRGSSNQSIWKRENKKWVNTTSAKREKEEYFID